MEKTIPDIGELVNEDFRPESLLSAPFGLSEEGIQKYFTATNSKRSDYQDHAPEGILFLAYLKHNLTGVTESHVELYLKAAQNYLADANIGKLSIFRGYCACLPADDKAAISRFIFQASSSLYDLAPQKFQNAPEQELSFGHHLVQVLNSFSYVLC